MGFELGFHLQGERLLVRNSRLLSLIDTLTHMAAKPVSFGCGKGFLMNPDFTNVLGSVGVE